MAGVTERVIQANPIGAAGGRVLISPFQFTLDEDDNLRVVAANSASGVKIAIQGWRIDSVGERHPIAETITPATDRSKTTTDFTLGKGALQFLTVFVSAGTPKIGQTYVLVELIRGSTGAKLVMGTLLAGYISTSQALGWPGSPIQNSLDGRGWLHGFLGTQPAAGSAVSQTVPTGAVWRVQTVFVTLTTDANAGTRVVLLETTCDGVNSGDLFVRQSPMTASNTSRFTFAPGIPNDGGANGAYITYPLTIEQRLKAGDTITVNDISGFAGDQFGFPGFTVEEWLDV